MIMIYFQSYALCEVPAEMFWEFRNEDEVLLSCSNIFFSSPSKGG